LTSNPALGQTSQETPAHIRHQKLDDDWVFKRKLALYVDWDPIAELDPATFPHTEWNTFIGRLRRPLIVWKPDGSGGAGRHRAGKAFLGSIGPHLWYTLDPANHPELEIIPISAGARNIVWALIDSVSRGKSLLLQMSPTQDGHVPEAAKTTSVEVKNWLDIHGMGIFDTQPWKKPAIWTEGVRSKEEEHLKPIDRIKRLGQTPKNGQAVKKVLYTFDDYKNTLYAMTPGWPNNPLTLFDVPISSTTTIKLSGYDGEIQWQGHNGHIQIELPDVKPNAYSYAYTFEITDIP
jgi:hypothetical protein